MHILFFDTSCDFILVGLYTINESGIKQDYFYSGNHPREASYRLIGDIDTGLKSINLSKPDAIVCCQGPGSFTGIRISVATARNLSQVWKIPTLGIDTIELYSAHYSELYQSPVLVAIDGKQKKVFAGFSNGEDYKGTYDILPSEISSVFKNELKFTNTIVISDIDSVKHNYSLLSSLPNPMSVLQRKILTLQNLNLKDNSYFTLLPNYMRETYAHK